MSGYSQIVRDHASPISHSMGGADFLQILQTVNMKSDKNGGPNHLRAWREKRQLSQQQLADALNTTTSVISYLEQGERGLSAKWLRKLAAPLKITPGLLLDHDPADLSDDMIEMWVAANSQQKRQITDIARAILHTGTDD